MTDQLFDPDVIATADAEALPGSRLHRLEVYNWGTFDQKVWTFDVGGRNALLTGDIGSGKSTLVDAVTTLLLPANRIAYNKAAGADARERDLRSYVLGHYKSERNETTGTSRPVGLRDTRHYSVILGVFTNVGYGDTVTLAQVFRARDVNQGQPDRFYVVAESDLSIAKDFSDFGDEIAGLRRKLRERGARLYDSFPDYGRDFRRQLGIESEQAMELFHQTVSMKAVDNLNDFVRSHMLEPFETRDRIDALVGHFDDLTKAYEAVLRARAQLELLTPLVTDLDAHEGFGSAIDLLERQSRALPFLFAQRTKTLIKAELAMLVATIDELDVKIGEAEGRLRDLRGVEAELGLQIAGCGGDRMAALEEARRRLESEDLPSRKNRLNRFNELLREAGLDEVTVAEQFSAVRQRADTRELELKTRVTELDNDLTERRHQHRQLRDDAQSVNDELQSLQARHSNLPRRSLELRDQLCSDLKIDSAEVPSPEN
ncbi:MAG: hypothetical protein IPG46_13960 [Actinobacteria bacterium]|nr:hypothetical protein [Actinomycetota bacterium]